MTSPNLRPVVVDTNVVSYIYRDDPLAALYRNDMIGRRAVISFQTREELLYGVLRSDWGEPRRRKLLTYVDATYEMIGYDRELVNACARLRAAAAGRGRALSQADAWIAATAIRLQCPLLSHDRDFGRPPELQLINHAGGF